MNRTAQEWAEVKAAEVTAGSIAQATNVLQMALEDIAALAAADRRVWKALGIETFAQAGFKEPSEIVAAQRHRLEQLEAHIDAGGKPPLKSNRAAPRQIVGDPCPVIYPNTGE